MAVSPRVTSHCRTITADQLTWYTASQSCSAGANTRMKLWMLLTLLLTALLTADSATTYRMCGEHLADFLALVCGQRGYNQPQIHSRTARSLGIVDECCKSSCPLSVWEQYCVEADKSATSAPTEPPLSNHIDVPENQLRKSLRTRLMHNPARVFRIGTIAPYYESNHVIAPIDESNIIVQHH